MESKICVYAICKNEAQFVTRWLDSMSEADYIVVLDTGSEDNTYDLLKNDNRVYKCEQKVISPWRFDSARNESMKLIPEDADILMCTDLDEFFEPGWAKVIKDNWVSGYHIRGYYKYAWSHTPTGEPGRIFYYDKLHDRNWKWRAPVHEMLYSDIEEYNSASYLYEHTIDLFDKGVYLHHFPDSSKSRSSYLPLLELRAEEDKNDYYGKYYLAHEYYYRGYYDKSIDTLTDILNNPLHNYRLTAMERAAAYLFMGDSYKALGSPFEAIINYMKAIEEEETYREPYFNAAEVCNDIGLYNLAIGYVLDGIEQSTRHYSWLERDDSWSGQPHDILSISYYYIGEYEKAYEHVLTARKLDPTSERIIFNEKCIKDKLEENK